MVLDALRFGFSNAVKWAVISTCPFLGEKRQKTKRVSFHHAKFIEVFDVKMSFISPKDGDKRSFF